MKICLAQTQFKPGNIRENIDEHTAFISKAIELGADAIYFPELSLTGYEPEQVVDLAFDPSDLRLLPFQVLSSENNILIGIGIPIQRDTGITISMAILQPEREVLFYNKEHLHSDEVPHFIAGENLEASRFGDGKTALAICYEISKDEHVEKSVTEEVSIYLASVAKYADGVANAMTRLPDIARKHKIYTCMINGVGPADHGLCTGNSAIWNPAGDLLIQLDHNKPAMILFDTESLAAKSIEL